MRLFSSGIAGAVAGQAFIFGTGEENSQISEAAAPIGAQCNTVDYPKGATQLNGAVNFYVNKSLAVSDNYIPQLKAASRNIPVLLIGSECDSAADLSEFLPYFSDIRTAVAKNSPHRAWRSKTGLQTLLTTIPEFLANPSSVTSTS